MSNLQLSVVHDPDEALIQPVLEGIHRFGVEAIGGNDPKKLAVLLTLDGHTVGGATGHEIMGLFYLTHLWVAPEQRGQGHGGELLAAIESEVARQGCIEVRLDTMNAKSIPFYERYGYDIYARVPEYIPGFERVFMRKIKRTSNIGVEPPR